MPHLHPDEVIVRRFDHHFIRFVVPVISYLFIISILGAIGYFTFISDGEAQGIIFVIIGTLFLCATHTLFRFLLSEALEVGYITQYRLVYFSQRIFVKDDIFEIPFDTVKNVIGQKRGILANLLSFGDLRFTPESTVIRTIPSPDRIAELILELTGKL